MNWMLAIPEITLSLSGLLILLFGVIQKKSNPFFPCTILSVVAFITVGFLTVTISEGSGYYGLFVNDTFARFMKLLIVLAGLLCNVLSLSYNKESDTNRFEFPVLVLFSTVGAMLMVSASNLMTLYMGLELSSLSLYILCAFNRDHILSAESGIKYFILGSLASGLLLYGISLIYGFSGGMGYNVIAQALLTHQMVSIGLIVGLVFVLVGLCFKISAVPFHMWTPDVYQGAPTSVTVFLSTSPKFAAFALLLRMMMGPFEHIVLQWQLLIEIIAVISIIVGSVGAIAQMNIKRMMAYSSISHMGYALIGLAAATPQGVSATLIYLTTYMFMNVGAFSIIITMRRQGHFVEQISDLSGLGVSNPALAMAMAVFMFSMAGVPPLAGFFGKFLVFGAAISSHLITLAVIGIIASIIGAYFYLRIVKIMYFDQPIENFDRPSFSLSFLSLGMGVATVGFLIFMGPIMTISQLAAISLFK